MATDMDIDMGLDMDIGQDYSTEQDAQIELHPDLSAAPISIDTTNPDATTLTPHKIHLRGLDDLTTKDIKSFAEEYSAGQPLERVEWIDDTSANIIYASPEAASAALEAFVAADQLPANYSTLDMLTAKPFPNFPNTRLMVRLAVEGDKKQPGARERSRFYLLNPEHEPQERRRRDDRGGRGDGRNRSRRDNYRRRDYDDRETRRRSDDFDVSLYDDDEASLARRSREPESESGSTSGYRNERSQRVRFAGVGKELFPEKITSRSNGRLRNRSASPMRDNEGDLILDARPSDSRGGRGRHTNDGGANRRKAQVIKDRLKASASEPLELFPRKAAARNDATDATADLFANKLRIPMVDGASDRSSAKPDLMSRITRPGESDADAQSSFKIRGTAKQQPAQDGFSIKGLAASGQGARELFPGKAGGNAGKELFADRLEGRGVIVRNNMMLIAAPLTGGEYSQYSQLSQQPQKQHTLPLHEDHNITKSIHIVIKMGGLIPFPFWGTPFLDAGHTNTPSSSWHSNEAGLSPQLRGLANSIHNPTADQLAETLKVVLMTNGSHEPVPAEYTSCVLEVLEGYNKTRLELAKKKQELEEAKKEKEETESELWQKTLEWKEEESRYKTEIKKLEVILAKTPGGMELVSVARAQSVLRRDKKKAEAEQKAKDKEQEDNPDAEYVPRRLRPGFNILRPDFAERKDAAVTKKLMPRSNSVGFGSVGSPPRPQPEEVAEPEKRQKRSLLGKLTHAGKKSAIRLFHGGLTPKKSPKKTPKKSPKVSPKKSKKSPKEEQKEGSESPKKIPKKKQKGAAVTPNPQNQADADDSNLQPNGMWSTRSLWGHFGRGPPSLANMAAKAGGDAQSAPAGASKQESPKKLKHKASATDLAKSPKKPKRKASIIDLVKSPRKPKHKASAIDLVKSPRKDKGTTIDLETAAAVAAKAPTRKRTWLFVDNDDSENEGLNAAELFD
ncbi:hypothetical protein V490_08401 [Pseudogymnoascus sp. VKM F-3557]|nr:hypothetical protein V490_08401 [Pseudogymnoascus sp. VKM F-3557]